MAAKGPKETKRSSDAAVKAKTGKVWAEWFKILDTAGAKKWAHKEIAGYLFEKRKLPGWWAQMVAVGYEHERGMRAKFQNCNGDFAANSSRTLVAPAGKVYEAWTDEKIRRRWLAGSESRDHESNQGKINSREVRRRHALERLFLSERRQEDTRGRGSHEARDFEGCIEDEKLLV